MQGEQKSSKKEHKAYQQEKSKSSSVITGPISGHPGPGSVPLRGIRIVTPFCELPGLTEKCWKNLCLSFNSQQRKHTCLHFRVCKEKNRRKSDPGDPTERQQPFPTGPV